MKIFLTWTILHENIQQRIFTKLQYIVALLLGEHCWVIDAHMKMGLCMMYEHAVNIVVYCRYGVALYDVREWSCQGIKIRLVKLVIFYYTSCCFSSFLIRQCSLCVIALIKVINSFAALSFLCKDISMIDLSNMAYKGLIQ